MSHSMDAYRRGYAEGYRLGYRADPEPLDGGPTNTDYEREGKIDGYKQAREDFQQWEKDRLEDLQEAQETFANCDLELRFGPGSFGHHELTDRAFMVSEMFAMVMESPATIIDPAMYGLANRIYDLMWEFYQRSALKDVDAEEKSWPIEGHHEEKE